MQTFTHQDIEDYYDQTEIHYRMWWKLEDSMGLHYGVWNDNTRSISEAVINLNKVLSELIPIEPKSRVLDAGCGVGGSSFYLAETKECTTTGVTLSQKQADTAKQFARNKGLSDQCSFAKCSYTQTGFDDETFDLSWAIESLGSASDKGEFFREMHRILKPGGKILIADTFKSYSYSIEDKKLMQEMLNPWAISDIPSKEELIQMAENYGFRLINSLDVTKEIRKSVNRIYFASLLGKVGTKVYNFFKNASRFSKIHYISGLAQKKTYENGDWKYLLFAFEKK